MSFRERLLLVINELKLNRNSFADRLGYEKNSYIYEYTRETPKPKEPGFDFFHRFVLAKTGIALDWLITGEGDMYEKKGTAATNNVEAAVNRDREELYKDLEFFRGEVSRLNQIILNLSIKAGVIDQGHN